MTWPAVPPHAALRILRTAAGRRALQVALLVGGLFALGFLCGGQASAAEGVPTAPTISSHAAAADADGGRSLAGSLVGRLVKPPAEPDVHHPVDNTGDDTGDDTGTDTNTVSTTSGSEDGGALADALDSLDSLGGGGDESNRLPELLPPPVKDVEEQVLRPVTEQVVGVVDGEVLQPVGDLVETVTEQLDEVQSKLPLLPSLPEEPSLPGLPGLPTAPGLPELPVQTLPDTTVPVTTVPQPESPVAGSPDGDDSGKQSGRTAATAAFYGPPSVAGSPTTGTAAQTGGQRAAQAAHTPVQQAPADDPGGAPGNRSTADGSSSRHVDAHAVSLNHRAPLRLVAGAAARTDAAGTRDRHRDIPVSPA